MDGGPAVRLSDQLSTVAGFPDPATVVLAGLGFEESGRAPVVRVALAGGEPQTLVAEGYGRSALSPQGRLAYAQLDRLRRIAGRLSEVGGLSRDSRTLLATRRAGGSRILRITVGSGRVRVLARRASAPSWSR